MAGVTPRELELRSKAYFENLLNSLILWIASHQSYGVTPEEEEYRVWEEKLVMAAIMLRDCREGKSLDDPAGSPL